VKALPAIKRKEARQKNQEIESKVAELENEWSKKWEGSRLPDRPDEGVQQTTPKGSLKPLGKSKKAEPAPKPTTTTKPTVPSESADAGYVKGVKEAKNVTDEQAQEYAKNAIRKYVQRGDSIGSLKQGQGGGTLPGFHGSYNIGGFIDDKRVTTDNIIIELADGRVYKYKLKDIYNSVKNERTENTKPAKSPEVKTEKPKATENVKPASSGTTYKLRYPETKELPKNMQEKMPIDQKEFQKSGKQKPKQTNKVTKREANELLGIETIFRRTDVKELLRS
jgi:hypothetical protein